MKQYILQGIIENFEGKDAVIKFEDGQTLRVPVKNLPDDAEKGGTVRFAVKTAESDKQERELLAKEILNEMLKKQ